MPSFFKSAMVLLLASPLLVSVVAVGCSDEPQVQTSGSGASGSGASGGIGGIGGMGGMGGIGGSTGGAGGTGNIPDAGPDGWASPDGGFVTAACVNQVYQCGDTLDNDGDGLVDWQDPECLGPCDNSETGLGVSIPGGAGAACITDCFWDSNSGTGNDECYWNHQCDPLSKAPDFYPEWWNGNKCAYNANANTPGTNLSCDELLNNQPETCKQVCPELTPNGCDCFGCCVVYKEGQKHGPVWLGTENGQGSFSCDLDHLDDPKSCAPCTQVKGACYNECGTCELCIGKDTLPPECFPPPPDGGVDGGGGMGGTDAGPPPEQCPDGLQPCGLPGQDPCGAGFYCITGCCIEQPK